jgi:molybdenum cofactor cytidylyltransferase
VAVAVLAAGASRRMGVPKLLVPFGASTLLGRAVEAAQESGAGLVFVVTGAYHGEMRERLSEARVAVVRNAQWDEGQSTSIRTAVRFCEQRGFDALLVMVADQPFVEASHLRALMECYRIRPGDVFVTEAGVRRGNPCLFNAHSFDALKALEGDEGARRLFADASEGHGLRVCPVPCDDKRVFEDVDTPADLHRLEADLR